MRLNAERAERVDHPAFERVDEAADVLPPPFEVEHHVADPLAGPVIGVATAASRLVDGESLRIGELGRIRAGAGGEQRRVLEQPHTFARAALADG